MTIIMIMVKYNSIEQYWWQWKWRDVAGDVIINNDSNDNIINENDNEWKIIMVNNDNKRWLWRIVKK